MLRNPFSPARTAGSDGKPAEKEGVYSFVLFVAGDSVRSSQAEQNLRRMADARLGAPYELVVVDVTADPERAERERILTTPTVLKTSPGTPRKVTGDLSDIDKVMLALALPEQS